MVREAPEPSPRRLLGAAAERHLPGLVRLLRAARARWDEHVWLDRRMTRELAAYFRVTPRDALCLMKLGTRLNAELWNALRPESVEGITRFYRVNPFYIFSLAYWHMTRGQRRLRQRIVRVAERLGTNVLDYGGGIGDLTLQLAQAGLQVTYADVGGRTFEFARWHLARRGSRGVTFLNVETDQERLWSGPYQAIVCLDVIEHVPDPEDLLRRMACCLARGGGLVITGLEAEPASEEHPMHLPLRFDPEQQLRALGLERSAAYPWLWLKRTGGLGA